MALKSLLKKVFSFGSRKVEEQPADDAAHDAAALAEEQATAAARAAEDKAKAEAEAADAVRKAEEERAAARRAEEERIAAEEAAAAQADADRLKAEQQAAEEEAVRKAEADAERARIEAEAKAAAEEAEAERKAAEEAEARARAQAEEAARRADEQRAAAERAEAERIAAEEAAAAQADADRLKAAQQAADEEAVRKAEADAERARIEAEARAVAEKAEEERKAAEVAEAEAARRAEAERLAAEEAAAAERAAAAKAEEERRLAKETARAEAERKAAQEDAERKAAAERARAEEAAQPSPSGEPPATPASPAGKVTVTDTVAAAKAAEPAPEPVQEKKSWLRRLRDGLSRSSRELTQNVTGLFTRRKLDEDTLQDLEDILIQADLGLETAIRITDALSQGRYGKNIGDDEVRAVMGAEIEKVLQPVAQPLELDLSHSPHVILVVGVNGTGKTTTIGKLAAKLREGGLDVMLAAGDTFRAAAIEQLHIWGDRVGAPVVSTKLGADAAGLAYDAFEKAKEAGSDVLIIDTAGRLQNKTELMDELAKIVRVLGKLDPEAPHTVLQTLDATTGQNALSQVEIFRNVAGVNGLVMTKLDGTARGGILVAIAAKHKLPVYFVGVGEQVDDLEPFAATDFAKAIVGEPEQEMQA